MSFQEVFAAINQMKADGVIDRYAIGGAVGAMFYLEPVATLDVDVFIAFRPELGETFLHLKPIFDYLTTRGAAVNGENIVLRGGPFSFCRRRRRCSMKQWRTRVKIRSKASPSGCSRPNIWRRSH